MSFEMMRGVSLTNCVYDFYLLHNIISEKNNDGRKVFFINKTQNTFDCSRKRCLPWSIWAFKV